MEDEEKNGMIIIPADHHGINTQKEVDKT